MTPKRIKHFETNIFCAVRDALNNSDSSPEFAQLAAACAYIQLLEMFNELGYENPSIREINQMRERVQELAQQNHDFRKQLGLPEEALICRWDTKEDKGGT